MKKYGFTLAEVLITLAIIGIVAALTIPSVISNYQQQEFKTGLKKAVSVLNEAIQTNIAQDGETPYENSDLQKYLMRHMSVLKTMKRVVTCYNSDGDFIKNTTGELDLENCKSGSSNEVFYTTDGMRFEILKGFGSGNLKLHETGLDLHSSRIKEDCFYCGSSEPCCNTTKAYNEFCGSYGLANNPNNTTVPPCIVMVDINGDKKPNYLEAHDTISDFGISIMNAATYYTYPSPTDKKLQDVFNILITDEKAIPFGVVAQRAMYSK